MAASGSEWQRVVIAAECAECKCCGEPFCNVCDQHYAECACPGPMQDDEYEYLERDGVMYAKEK